jgi:hypothetical protein
MRFYELIEKKTETERIQDSISKTYQANRTFGRKLHSVDRRLKSGTIDSKAAAELRQDAKERYEDIRSTQHDRQSQIVRDRKSN